MNEAPASYDSVTRSSSFSCRPSCHLLVSLLPLCWSPLHDSLRRRSSKMWGSLWSCRALRWARWWSASPPRPAGECQHTRRRFSECTISSRSSDSTACASNTWTPKSPDNRCTGTPFKNECKLVGVGLSVCHSVLNVCNEAR